MQIVEGVDVLASFAIEYCVFVASRLSQSKHAFTAYIYLMCCIASDFFTQTSLGNISILTIQSSPAGVLFNNKVNSMPGLIFF